MPFAMGGVSFFLGYAEERAERAFGCCGVEVGGSGCPPCREWVPPLPDGIYCDSAHRGKLYRSGQVAWLVRTSADKGVAMRPGVRTATLDGYLRLARSAGLDPAG